MNKSTKRVRNIPLLIAGLPDEVFFGQFFERSPYFGKTAFAIDITFDDVFGILHQAHARNDVRFTKRDGDGDDLPKNEIDSRMKHDKSGSYERLFRRLFENENISFLIKNISNYLPRAGKPLQLLNSALEGQLYDFCLMTPPGSAASSVHYDDADVFAFNVHGVKKWDLYEPITQLPNPHIYREEIGDDLGPLKCRYHYTLNPGDCLYMPRGWIHDVINDSDSPSLQVAVSYKPDTWIGLLSNALAYAYNRISAMENLRTSVRLDDLETQAGRDRFMAMKEEFDLYFEEAMSAPLSAHLDFIHGVEDNKRIIDNVRPPSDARRSHSSEEEVLVPSGARFLMREHNSSGFLSITSNGTDYFYVPIDFWKSVIASDTCTVSDLVESTGYPREEVVEYVDILTTRLGIYTFSPLQDPRAQGKGDR